jgi:hypothetical protein
MRKKKRKVKDEQSGEKIASDANTIKGQRDVQYSVGTDKFNSDGQQKAMREHRVKQQLE